MIARLLRAAGHAVEFAATGLGAQEFKNLQKAVSRLRDSLIESTRRAAD